jgi:toxin FitB
MIILDTNVVSALMHAAPDPVIATWFDEQFWPEVWTTSITVHEIRYGLALMQSEVRRAVYASTFNDFLTDAIYKVAYFDDRAAEFSAELAAARKKRGRVIDIRDTMIAGIALAMHADAIATRNVRHFDDLSIGIMNPWS